MKRTLLLALVILFLVPVSKVLADSPAPIRDFSVETPNGEFLFVMLAQDIDDSYNQLGFVQENEALRQTYSQSGLYRNDGSNTPLWTVDWNAFGVILSDDGRYLVRWGPWAFRDDYSEIAVEFYRDGELLKSYKVNELVANPSKLPHSVSHYMWLEDSEEDLTNNTIWITTLEGRRYVFDMTTGALIEGTLPSEAQSPLNLAVVATVVLLLVGLLVYWRWRKTQAQSQSL